MRLLVFLALVTGLRAELLPSWPVTWMCGEADAIVVGERIGASVVKVEEWLLPPGDGLAPEGEIEIVGLDEHSRLLGEGGMVRNEDGTVLRGSLRSRRLMCFLERKGVAWYSMSPGGSGSSGLVWIEEGRSYRYKQFLNPGPYTLAPDATEKELREEVSRGLVDRRTWEETLEMVHPEEQAIVLACYLLPRTSPEGNRGTYLQRIRQVLPQLGRAAVSEVMELLQSAQPGDQLDEAVLVLYDLGTEARPAVPLLVDLLEKPEQVHPVRILEALGRIGDATVAHDILPLLAHQELQVRSEAAKALAAFRYEDAAVQIAECLPVEVGDGEAYYVYAALMALKELDPGRAAELTKRFLDQPAMKHVRNLLEPLLQGAGR